jgi:hypothetical protein
MAVGVVNIGGGYQPNFDIKSITTSNAEFDANHGINAIKQVVGISDQTKTVLDNGFMMYALYVNQIDYNLGARGKAQLFLNGVLIDEVEATSNVVFTHVTKGGFFVTIGDVITLRANRTVQGSDNEATSAWFYGQSAPRCL